MAKRLRIFISSPADVPDERLRADLIIDKLAQDYGRFFRIESYRWEHEPMLASGHFQDAIEPPSAFDIVVVILWSRLGTPLPLETSRREYRGIDGRAPVTGTEWEYEEALKAAREKGAPDMLAFRNISPAPIDPLNADMRARSNAQLDALDAFWRRHFADRGQFLAAYDEYRTIEEFARRFEEQLRKLIERRITVLAAGASRPEPIWLGDPFRGLEPYEFEHAPIFFGRDALVARAAEQLAMHARSGEAFLLVLGASGSGKSSLVKAAVVPRLMKPQRISGLAFLRRVVFQPGLMEGTDLFLGLAQALTRKLDDDDVGLPELIAPGQDAAKLAAHLRAAVKEPGFLFGNALGRLTQTARERGRLLAFEEARLILAVDQLEELFTLPGIGAEERRAFLALLGGLAASQAVWVIATLRADYWHRVAETAEFVALAQGLGRLDVAPPSPAELAEMIRKPVQAAGLAFETHPETGLGLDAVLAEHAAAAPGVLPLLSFTLDELYKDLKTRGGSVLTYASYAALGGLEGAIAQRADETVAALPGPAQATLPRVLRALTTVSASADPTPVARPAALADFAEGSPARALIDALTSARLLVASSQGGTTPTVRLAHEALISRWRRAREQLVEDRRDLETRSLVEDQLRRWRVAPRHTRGLLLLRNPDLANAVDLAKRWGDEIDAATRDFIKRSRQRARWRQQLTAAAAVVFALIAGIAVFAAADAVQQSREADRQRDLAARNEQTAKDNEAVAVRQRDQALLTQSRFLADLSEQQTAAGNAVGGMLLALEALPDTAAQGEQRGRPYAAEAERALYAGYFARRELLAFAGHDQNVTGARFSSDGQRVLTASADGTARLWDARTGRTIAIFRGHEKAVRGAVFDASERRVLTWSTDGTARVFDAQTAQTLVTLRGHTTPPTMAAFLPDGNRIVMVGDTTVRVWNAGTGEPEFVLTGHSEGDIPKSSFGFTGAEAEANGQRLKEIAKAAISDAALTPDGSRLVTAGKDHTARVWDLREGKQVAVFEGHTAMVLHVAVSPDGKLAATTSFTPTGHGETRIWEIETAKEVAVFVETKADLGGAVAFSPDGRQLVATAGNDTVVLEAASGKPIARLTGHTGIITHARFSADGRLVLTASWDGTARLWEASTGRGLIVFGDHQGWVVDATFSPDGSRVLTASATARLFSLQPGAESGALLSYGSALGHPAVSPDARFIAAPAWQTGDVPVWSIETGRLVSLLRVGPDLSMVAFSPDSRGLAALARDGVHLLKFNPERQRVAFTRLRVIPFPPGRTGSFVAFSPDGKYVLNPLSDHTVRISDASTGQDFAVLSGHQDMVITASYSPDGKQILTASRDRTLRLWDATTGKERLLLSGHEAPIIQATFSPDGTKVISVSPDRTVRVWDAATGAVLTTITREDAPGIRAVPTSAALSRDGHYLAIAYGTVCLVWDLAALKEVAELHQLAGSFGYFSRVAFSPDGQRLASVGGEWLHLWDWRQELEVAAVPTPHRLAIEVLFIGEEGLLATMGNLDEKLIRLWRAFPNVQMLVDHTKSSVPRCLTPAERERLFLVTESPWCFGRALWPYSHVRLGVLMQTMSESDRLALRLGRSQGVLVGAVQVDSPAGTAGIRTNDVILSVDGVAASSPKTVADIVAKAEPGQELILSILRDGKGAEVRARLRPQN